MYITTKNFMQFLMNYSESLNTTIVLLRTIGPDNATDAEKANAVYSAYYMNMQSENPKIFDTMLYNEFTFVEFSDEESAWEFCRDNFPLNRDIDDDYFVQYVIYSNGMYVRGNDGNNGLREPIPQPVE